MNSISKTNGDMNSWNDDNDTHNRHKHSEFTLTSYFTKLKYNYLKRSQLTHFEVNNEQYFVSN